jgi:hypothetical protein
VKSSRGHSDDSAARSSVSPRLEAMARSFNQTIILGTLHPEHSFRKQQSYVNTPKEGMKV